MRNAHGTPTTVGVATVERMVCVARDQDDPRSIDIPFSAFGNPHVATDCGGRKQRLARPAIGGYMSPLLIPDGAPFGYSGSHQRERPVPIKVIVQEDRTHPSVLAELRALTARAKLRGNYRRPLAAPAAG